MVEPISVGSFVVSVIAKIAAAGLSEFGKGAGKSLYDTIKSKVAEWVGAKIDVLEAAPDSEKIRKEIAVVIDNQNEEFQNYVYELARKIVEQEIQNPNRSIGLDFTDIHNVNVELKRVSATGNATGARFQGVRDGTIIVGEASASDSSTK